MQSKAKPTYYSNTSWPLVVLAYRYFFTEVKVNGVSSNGTLYYKVPLGHNSLAAFWTLPN